MDALATCILQGETHQATNRYVLAQNSSCVANAVCFIASNAFLWFDQAHTNLIDDIILPAGFDLFMSSISPPRFIEVEELSRSFSFGNRLLSINNIEIIIQGKYPVESSQYTYVAKIFTAQLEPHLNIQAASEGFIFIGLGRSVAFLRINMNYYVFDSHAVGPNGLFDFNNGRNNVSRIFRCSSISSLAKFLLIHGQNGCDDFYSVTRLRLDLNRIANSPPEEMQHGLAFPNNIPLLTLSKSIGLQSDDMPFPKIMQSYNDSSQDNIPLYEIRKQINKVARRFKRKRGRPGNYNVKPTLSVVYDETTVKRLTTLQRNGMNMEEIKVAQRPTRTRGRPGKNIVGMGDETFVKNLSPLNENGIEKDDIKVGRRVTRNMGRPKKNNVGMYEETSLKPPLTSLEINGREKKKNKVGRRLTRTRGRPRNDNVKPTILGVCDETTVNRLTTLQRNGIEMEEVKVARRLTRKRGRPGKNIVGMGNETSVKNLTALKRNDEEKNGIKVARRVTRNRGRPGNHNKIPTILGVSDETYVSLATSKRNIMRREVKAGRRLLPKRGRPEKTNVSSGVKTQVKPLQNSVNIKNQVRQSQTRKRGRSAKKNILRTTSGNESYVKLLATSGNSGIGKEENKVERRITRNMGRPDKTTPHQIQLITLNNVTNVINQVAQYQTSTRARSENIVKTQLFSKYRNDDLKKIELYSLKFTSLNNPNIFVCPNCSAKLFFEEQNRKSWCCSRGSVNNSLNDVNEDFYKHKDFIRDARGFNNIFAFSALGVSHGFQHPRQGITFLKIQGRMYHRIFDLSYQKSHNPLSLYVSDPSERDREAANRKLNTDIIRQISNFLNSVNPLIKLFKQLSQMQSEDAHIVFQNTSRRTHGNILGDMPQNREISFLYSTDRKKFEKKTIAVWKIGAAKPHSIDIMHELYEPLQYPLLYPNGTPGWRLGLLDNGGKKLSQLKYYRNLLLTVPRFSELGHLSDEWVCDMFCRTEEERLRFIQFSHGNARIARLNELTDETIAGETFVPGKVYLPNTFVASPRYMRTKYMDAMAIVNRMGKPSFFLTMTCNPNWPEIIDNKNNASFCARIFHEKMQQLVRDIKTGKWFGQVVYLFYCVEFQKRGLPHLHLAFKVQNPPVQTYEIEEFIRADIPSSDEADGKLRALVLRHMIHGPCGKGNRINLPCVNNDDKKCSKFFPKPANSFCYIDNRGFVHLKRDDTNIAVIGRFKTPVNDTWVVPYNAALLLRYDCHINLEVVATRNLPQYLYKYITKGPDFARVQVVSEAEKNSEIEEYVTKRYLSAPECCWRLFSYNIIHREPNVIQLPVHLEGQQSVIFRPGGEDDAVAQSSSALLIYLNRPLDSQFDNIQYVDFYEKFMVHTKRPSNATTEVFRHPDGRHYLTRRQRGAMVARMFWVPPSRGELFYLRLLLNVLPARSYQDLLWPGYEPCASFQSAAKSIGLANDDDEYQLAIKEASVFMTGRALRRFFVLIISNGGPGEKLWSTYKTLICSDIIDRLGNEDHSYRMGLIEIKRRLMRLGLTLEDVGLPYVIDDATELGRELLSHNAVELNEYLEEWVPKLSDDQLEIYNYVRGILTGENSDVKKSIFIDGPAGTGKTLLLNVIVAFVRSQGKVAICTATSGIAAQNYKGGMTAHSMFRFPIVLPDEGAHWSVSNSSERAQLLHTASLIIFDEAPMAHNLYFSLLERSLRDLMQSTEIFGGKVIIFSGDFRQIPPVVKGAQGKSEIITASLKSSELWGKLKICKLRQSQRNRDDPAYSKFLLRLGGGMLDTISLSTEKNAIQVVPVPQLQYYTDLNQLIDFTFPRNIIGFPDCCFNRAILSVLNVNINEINFKILKILDGPEIHLYSSDSMDESEEQAYLMGCDALNHIQAQGVPNHDLILKIGALCIITRNLSFEDGLLNGTKVIVVAATTRIVTIRKPGEQEIYAIPRISFTVSTDRRELVSFRRRQFPLQLAYALTVNKSQGQTLDTVGLDLRSDVFTHGQAYVAFGRVRNSKNIAILIRPDRVINKIPCVRNIVYSDLIDQ